MIKHQMLTLKEQKYIGISNTILFEEHDDIDFFKLHLDVLNLKIDNIDYEERFMALDTNFTKDTFDYIPLIPVKSYENYDDFFKFTREKGEYYAFKVIQKDCNPAWFKRVFEYIKENDLKIEHKGYDIEYYDKDYLVRGAKHNIDFKEEIYLILFKKKG